MNKKLITILTLLITVSCSGYSNKSNFGLTKSNNENLLISNFDNLKESKSCEDGSIRFFSIYLSLVTFGFADEIEAKKLGLDVLTYKAAMLTDKNGDSSIMTTAKIGGITKIKMVDHSYSITGIFSRRFCTIVYGE